VPIYKLAKLTKFGAALVPTQLPKLTNFGAALVPVYTRQSDEVRGRVSAYSIFEAVLVPTYKCKGPYVKSDNAFYFFCASSAKVLQSLVKL
jgi:hypothetical protein